MRRFKATALPLLLALALLVPATALAAPVAQPPDSLSPEALANATYAIDYVPGSPIILSEGVYENPDDRVYAKLLPQIAYGDMTGGGVEDAAVLVASNTGGSGVFIQLILMTDQDGQATQVASTLLGDRVNVQDLAIVDQTIMVTMVQQGPNDPMCCPTQQVTQSYVPEGDELVLVAEEVAEPAATDLSDEALANATYNSEYVEGGSVTLTDGSYESAPPEGETGPRVNIMLASDFTAHGDLNGDDVDDAAVILVSNTGGSGVFHDLAAVLNVHGEPQHVATAYLGDRVQINSVTIEERTVVIDMIQQGPDEPMCCPTQRTVRTYVLDDSGLTLVSEEYPQSAEAAEPPLSADAFDPDAEAGTATLNAGASETGGLDPAIVSVLSGAIGGERVAAAQLGINCAGVIPATPDVVVNWQPEEEAQTLNFFTLSTGDPTLVVVAPDGSVLCNDDVNPLLLDSLVKVESPQPGRYALFVGSFEGDAVAPALLVVTSHDTSPGAFDLNALAPRPAAAAVDLQRLPAATLLSRAEADAVLVRGANTPFTAELAAGGPVGAFNVDVGNELCTGFVTEEPTFSFRWVAQSQKMNLFFEGEHDTTLIVRDPNGAFQCADDADGAQNLNPQLILTSIPGVHDVWVGSFSPDETVDGVLTITQEVEAAPAPLTSAMVEGKN